MSILHQLMNLLEENNHQYLSLQEIAAQLVIPTSIVMESLKVLEKDGYQLSYIEHRGYCLKPSMDILSIDGITHYMYGIQIPILIYQTIDSTNTELKRLVEKGIDNHTLLIAETQTAGKGRLGRSFYSPNKKGIYMSILLNQKQSLSDGTMLTIQTAVAVKRAIYKVSQKEVTIKWVNDLFYNDLKVCGILTEAITDTNTGELKSLIVGIGLNVSGEFPKELETVATSLHLKNISRNQMIAEITKQLFIVVKEPITKIMKEYKDASNVLNKPITFQRNGKEYHGIAKDINAHGHLLVDIAGEQVRLQAGEVSIRKHKNPKT